MTQVKQGDTVRIHYTGTLDDGTEFGTSRGGAPLELQVGAGQVLPGLEAALPGMEVGETREVALGAEDAYGPRQPDAQHEFPRAEIPADVPLDIGTRLKMQTPDGKAVTVTVAEVGADSVTLDANHPLAGKDLNFRIELLEIA